MQKSFFALSIAGSLMLAANAYAGPQNAVARMGDTSAATNSHGVTHSNAGSTVLDLTTPVITSMAADETDVYSGTLDAGSARLLRAAVNDAQRPTGYAIVAISRTESTESRFISASNPSTLLALAYSNSIPTPKPKLVRGKKEIHALVAWANPPLNLIEQVEPVAVVVRMAPAPAAPTVPAARVMNVSQTVTETSGEPSETNVDRHRPATFGMLGLGALFLPLGWIVRRKN